jgi:putative dimethyl sulfoxide reductase chaperone
MIDVSERDDVLTHRLSLYAWCSAMLSKEQDRDTRAIQLGDEFAATMMASAAAVGVREEAAALVEALRAQRGRDVDEALLELAVDYAQLFIGPGPGQAPPFESVYTSSERRLYADAYADVIEVLHREGLAVDRAFAAPADHAAVELAVAAHLLEHEAGEGTTPLAADFLLDHFLNWFPRWCGDIVAHARTDFYRGLGRLMAAFLETERQRLAA